MKKILLLLLSLALILSCISCTELFGMNKSSYSVRFSVNGEITETEQRGALVLPKDPERNNYIFDGWFYDKACTQPLAGDDDVRDGDTLYAGWTLDYESIINSVAEKTQRANVTVYSTSYITGGFFGTVTEQRTANGSGVIFKETPDVYYALTNNHVVEKIDGYSRVSYTITDAYENVYDSVSVVCASAEYDLAVLKFRKTDKPLEVIELAAASPRIGDDVAAISQPNGQKNTLTVGKCTKIDTASFESDSPSSRVAFPVIYHDSPVDRGSSGGMLLNSDLKLCGIIFAVAYEKDSDEFVSGLSIPIEKVLEFLAEGDVLPTNN